MFIENKGRFDLKGRASEKDILFWAQQDGLSYYFTRNKIWIVHTFLIKHKEKGIGKILKHFISKEESEEKVLLVVEW